jgi:hypothetical protein
LLLQASVAFEFVDELAALLPKVNGTANRARLEHWVHAFGYHRAGGELACLLAVYNEAYTRAMAIKDPNARLAALKTTVVRTTPSLLPVLRFMHHILAALNTTVVCTTPLFLHVPRSVFTFVFSFCNISNSSQHVNEVITLPISN